MVQSLGHDVNTIADYICWRHFKNKKHIVLPQLHKFLYFVQAWHLGIYGTAIFDDDFEAWVYGPVCISIQNRFKAKPQNITKDDIDFKRLEELPDQMLEHIDMVLKNYMGFSTVELEDIYIRNEKPYLTARQGMGETERASGKIIKKENIMKFHADRLSRG